MPVYAYTARDRSGRTVEGTVQADNSALALGKVRQMGYEVEKVRALEGKAQAPCSRPPGTFTPPSIYTAPPRPERSAYAEPPAAPPRWSVSGRTCHDHNVSLVRRFAENFLFPVVSGVPIKDLATFFRQFATLIDAGIPLYQSLVTLEGQTKNARLREVIRECQAQAQAGGRLSDVFAGYSWVFSELQIEMIRAAEHGGMLDRMLLRIAEYLEQELALRRLISRLTIYPKIVLFMALVILGRSIFTDSVPAVSKLVLGQMGKQEYSGLDYLNDTFFFLGWIALGVFAVVAFCRIVLFQSDAAREGYERFKMAIPGLGTVVKQFALAKFGRAFGAMYSAGLPLNTAMAVAGRASGSHLIAHATRRAIFASERGATLSQALRETGVFPNVVLDMLHTGEQTGNLDAMMTKTAEYLEGEAETKAHQYSHIFATGIYLLVVILVGMAVVGFWSGYAGAAAGGME